jgi:hypothetical protein
LSGLLRFASEWLCFDEPMPDVIALAIPAFLALLFAEAAGANAGD